MASKRMLSLRARLASYAPAVFTGASGTGEASKVRKSVIGIDRLFLAKRIHAKEVQQFLKIAARALCLLCKHRHRHYDRLTWNSEVSFGKSTNKSSAKNSCSMCPVSSPRSNQKTFVEILSEFAGANGQL